MHPVAIENEHIFMEIWPQIGGKVSSIVDKADHFELLFSYPAELPDAPYYDVSYADHLHSGWDECFPAVAAGKYPRHPYEGICVPDHGELWGIPATTAVPTKNGITTVWNGLRFGYRLTRKLYLEGPSVIAEYSLTNLAPFEFHYVWAMHPLMAMEIPVELDCPTAGRFRLSHDVAENPINLPFTWPRSSAGEDYSHPGILPAKSAWKLFSADPIQGCFRVSYPTRKRSVRMEYTSESGLPAYWGIWISTGGDSSHRLFSIQPTTGRYDRIDQAVKDNSAGRVEAFGRHDWAVRWALEKLPDG